jgi:RND superfamily putative drug exporter
LGAFERLGRLAARRRWLVVAAWLLLGLVALPLAPRAAETLQPGGFTSDQLEAARARKLLEDRIGLPTSALVIVIESETDARAGDPEFEAAVDRALAGVPGAEHVTGVLTHRLAPRQVSEDGRTVYAVVTLDLIPDRSPDALEPVQASLRQVPGIRTAIAGGPAFYGDIQRVSEEDLQRSELIGLPLAAIVLLVVFGSVVAAGVPVVVGGLAVLVALATIAVVASLTPMSIFVLNLATLLGFGLGVDYALLMTSRFREELARGVGVEDAIASSMTTAGRAVFFSGITVMVGLAGLALFEFMVLRSVGLAGAIVVALAVSGALTLLPAVLAILGTRVDTFAVGLARRRARADRDGAWRRLANLVMDHPVAVFVPTLAFLLVLGLPFLHVRLNAPDASILPPDVPSRQAATTLTTRFQQGEFAPLLLAVRTEGPVTDPATVGTLYDWSHRIAADPRVARVDSIVDIDPRLDRAQHQLLLSRPGGPADRYVAEQLRRTTNGDVTAFTVITRFGPNAQEARELVHDLRDPGSALAPPAGVSVLVGGGAAEVVDVVDGVAAQFPRTLVVILVATWLILFVLLRSVVLPIKALVMNTLSIVASFGALVWIFQDGNLSAPLGFTPLGYVETTLPVILFCVLFGLSMDYEVFLLSRMKEAWDRTVASAGPASPSTAREAPGSWRDRLAPAVACGDNREAVASGLERSGRIVSSAALVVVVVAGSFAFADIVLIKALGVGVAVAVALDATVVRGLLVPSTMRLLGRWNWWMPARLERAIGSRLPVIESATLALIALSLVGCSSGLLLANPPPADHPSGPPKATVRPARDPQPIALPRDDRPHDRLTEWWYYTGHLRAGDGRRFGFEFVVFRAERGSFPVAWASHLALTDEDGDRFLYDQRSEVGGAADRSHPDKGFDLVVAGESTPGAGDGSGSPWVMAGSGGLDRLEAVSGQAFGIDLELDGSDRPVAYHDHDGWVDFGPAGGSYYYSRTRMAARGRVTLDGQQLPVTGEAWFDHQWGDFITVGGGGWDWFAINLDDGTDLMLSLVRDSDGSYPLVYGTQVQPDGSVLHVPGDAFSVAVSGGWTSPATGIRYPAGWRVQVPGESLTIDLHPTVAAQELDTRASTGVVYWEGSQTVAATRAGAVMGGAAYVELTGYGPAQN